jgi:alpha-methylacyl-CoA racemase
MQKKLDTATASMAKYWCSDLQCKVIDECVQLHGGYGYMWEYPIARAWADARVQRIYGGTNEIIDGCAVMSMLVQGLRSQRLWVDRRQSNALDGGAHWYDCYQCADGEWISVGALEPQFYQLLLQKCGLTGQGFEQAQFDFANWPALKEKFAAVFRQRTRAEWCKLLEGTDVCFAPVLSFAEAQQHPHNRARGAYVEVDGIAQPAPAPRFSATPGEVRSPPVGIGADTSALLEVAGYSAEEIAVLSGAGVV